jgi:hypothetical protein
MADVEASVDISVHGAGSLEEAADAARDLAKALKDAEASAGSISGAFESAARSLASLRDDAEEAAQALKSIRDAGVGVGDVAATLGTSSEAASKLRDDLGEAEDALSSLVATGPGAADIAAFLEGDESAAASLRTALQGVADAEAEVAAGGAGMGDGAAGLEAEAAAAGHARDNLIEAAAAQDAVSSRAGSIEKTVADMRGTIAMMEQGQTALVSKIGPEQFGQVITKDADSLEILGGGLKNVKTSLDDLGDSAESRLGKLNLAQDFLSAGQAAGDVAPKIKAAWDAIAEAAPVINDAETEISGLREDLKGLGDSAGGGFLGGPLQGFLNILKGIGEQSASLDDLAEGGEKFKSSVEDQVAAMQKFSAAYHTYAATGAWDDLARLQSASDDLDTKMSAASNAGEDFSASFGDIDTAAVAATAGIAGAAGAVADVEQGVGAAEQDTGSFAASLGEVASSAGESIAGMAPMAGLIGGLVTAAAGLAPGLAAVTAGFVGFGALAFPALDKVKSGLSAVTTAQQAYEQAVGVEKRDPTTSNLAAEQKALATLKTTWAQLPAPVAGAVSAVRQFEHAWSAVSKSSGIQNDALNDIPKAIKAAENALPGLVGLAKSAAPVISSMFGDLASNEKSSQFKSFMGSLDKDVAPAANAFHNLAGAFGGFISQLQEKGAGAGNQFVNSLANLMKTATPTATTGLVNGVKALSSAMNGLNTATKSPALRDTGDVLDHLFHIGAEMGHGALKFNEDSVNALNAAVGGSKSPAWLKELRGEKVSIPVTPKVNKGALEQSLEGSPIPLPVKPEIKLDKAALEASLQGAPLPLPVKPEKIDTSALKGGDAKVPATAQVDKVDTAGINKAASNVKIHGVTVDLSDAKLSGLTALSSSLNSAGSSAGRSFDTGIASGISGGAGAAEGAARTVVSEIKSALSSLGGDGSAAGAALGQGLASGIAASTGAAVAAARTMANEVTAAVKSAHETQSPSKVFHGIATDDVKGYILGLEGGKSALSTAAKDIADGVTKAFKDTTITDTIAKLQTDLKDALKAGTISPTQETGISAWLDSDNKRLKALAAQRKDIEAKIASADALYKSVDTATVAGANVVTFAGNVASGGSSGSSSDGSSSSGSTTSQPTAAYQQQQIAQAVSMAQVQSSTPAVTPKVPQSLIANDSIQGQLKQYLDQTRSFKNDIVKLKKEGLDSTSLQQLLQAGVTSGLPAAQMMLSGGSKGVQQIAQLQKQIAAQAKQLGVTGANAAYESGSQIDGGLAAGLKSELSSVTAAIKSLATSIVDEMEKDLKIKSPSQVAFGIGTQFAAGMAGGINSGGPMVGAAARELAIVASKGASGYGGGMTAHPMPIVAGGAGGGGGGSQTMHFHLEVGGQEIAQVVQTYTLQHARRNTGSGLQLSGRGT